MTLTPRRNKSQINVNTIEYNVELTPGRKSACDMLLMLSNEDNNILNQIGDNLSNNNNNKDKMKKKKVMIMNSNNNNNNNNTKKRKTKVNKKHVKRIINGKENDLNTPLPKRKRNNKQSITHITPDMALKQFLKARKELGLQLKQMENDILLKKPLPYSLAPLQPYRVVPKLKTKSIEKRPLVLMRKSYLNELKDDEDHDNIDDDDDDDINNKNMTTTTPTTCLQTLGKRMKINIVSKDKITTPPPNTTTKYTF